jgi:protein-S-isoprenylcysteine O-methyltransferase Ste14
MEHALRLYFLGFYIVSITVFIAKVIPASLKVTPEQRAQGVARFLPPFLVLLNFVVPPILIFTHVGELDVRWLPVRVLGFVVSLCAAGMLLWAAATLGRFLVPQAMVLSDHDLVTAGPYRFVRHPAYSGDLGFWLGAALGTMNAILLLLWPVSVFGTYLQTRQEDALLASKFGATHESYAKRTGALVPRLAARSE